MQRLTSPLPATLCLSIIAAAVVYVLAKPLAVADLAIFMAMGRWMAENGAIFEQEIFAFTEVGRTFVNGTWLAQLVFYGLFQLGGYALLKLLSAACVGAALIFTAAHGAGRSSRVSMGALAALFAFVLALQNLGLRPQTFSIPLFTAAYFIADQHRSKAWAPLAIAAIFAVWPNLHGAFPAALGILLALTCGEGLRQLKAGGARRLIGSSPFRRQALLLGVAVLATLLNPYGPGIYLYVATNSQMPRARNLDEWLPAEPTSFMGIRLIVSIAFVAWILWRRWKKGDEAPGPSILIEDWVILGAFLWLAVGSQRMILWWGLAAAPLAAGHLGATLSPSRPPIPLHRWLFRGSVVLWALFLVAANPWSRKADDTTLEAEGYPGLHPDAPVYAIDALDRVSTQRQPLGNRVFNKMMWGSYLVWRLWPRYTPFVDPRIWVFGDQTWSDYLWISQAKEGWEAKLEGYGVNFLLLDQNTQGALVDAALASDEWTVLHRDGHAVVLERRRAIPREHVIIHEERE